MKKIKWIPLLLTALCSASAVSCGKNDASGSMRDISTAQVVPAPRVLGLSYAGFRRMV